MDHAIPTHETASKNWRQNREWPYPGLNGMEVVPGVRLEMLDVELDKPVRTQTERGDDCMEFAFVLSGHARAVSRYGVSTSAIEVKPDLAFSHYEPGCTVTFTMDGKQSLKMMGVIVDTSYLRSTLEDGECRMIQKALSAPETMVKQQTAISPLQKMVINQMLSCNLTGAARRMFLQGKAMELMAYQLGILNNDAGECQGPTPRALNRDETERIRYARETMKKHMADPPSLTELADMAGFNMNKLTRGFRAVYGKSAFSCLHDDRMERAMTLLGERRLNVSEVAWEIGYINVSHFSSAFHKRFGIRPKAFQLQSGKHFHPIP